MKSVFTEPKGLCLSRLLRPKAMGTGKTQKPICPITSCVASDKFLRFSELQTVSSNKGIKWVL